jgi:energy-coupling factor transporter transmembrane protein EcfT
LIDAFSTPRNRIKTLILLVICGLSAIGAAVVGIDDNPPGILLAYLAATAFVLAFVHPWRTARQFIFLLFSSVLGLALFVILNNLFAAVGHNPATAGMLQNLMQGFAVAAFFLATLICPAAIIVGAVGSVAVFIRSRRRLT